MFNTKSKIYQTEWLDLVFANRNKAYGAYELRLNYNIRLGRALLISSLFMGILFLYPLIKQRFVSDITQQVQYHNNDDIIDISLPPLEKRNAQPAAGSAAPKLLPLKVKSTRFVEPVVVNTPVTETPPTLAELQNSTVATQSSDGVKGSSDVNLAENGDTKGEGSGDSGASENTVFGPETLQKYPEFPGGMDAFIKFLRKNLRYPDRAAEAQVGGKVFVSFVIEKDGRLTDIKVLKGIGYGCDEEAIRVLKKSPSWKPGYQNNREVRVLYTIPMFFQM